MIILYMYRVDGKSILYSVPSVIFTASEFSLCCQLVMLRVQ